MQNDLTKQPQDFFKDFYSYDNMVGMETLDLEKGAKELILGLGKRALPWVVETGIPAVGRGVKWLADNPKTVVKGAAGLAGADIIYQGHKRLKEGGLPAVWDWATGGEKGEEEKKKKSSSKKSAPRANSSEPSPLLLPNSGTKQVAPHKTQEEITREKYGSNPMSKQNKMNKGMDGDLLTPTVLDLWRM